MFADGGAKPTGRVIIEGMPRVMMATLPVVGGVDESGGECGRTGGESGGGGGESDESGESGGGGAGGGRGGGARCRMLQPHNPSSRRRVSVWRSGLLGAKAVCISVPQQHGWGPLRRTVVAAFESLGEPLLAPFHLKHRSSGGVLGGCFHHLSRQGRPTTTTTTATTTTTTLASGS